MPTGPYRIDNICNVRANSSPPFMGVTLPGRDFKNNFDLISSFCEWQMIRSEPKQDKNKEMKKKLNIVETYVKH